MGVYWTNTQNTSNGNSNIDLQEIKEQINNINTICNLHTNNITTNTNNITTNTNNITTNTNNITTNTNNIITNTNRINSIHDVIEELTSVKFITSAQGYIVNGVAPDSVKPFYFDFPGIWGYEIIFGLKGLATNDLLYIEVNHCDKPEFEQYLPLRIIPVGCNIGKCTLKLYEEWKDVSNIGYEISRWVRQPNSCTFYRLKELQISLPPKPRG